ncbi:hypothetical protein HanHA300_Chr01g0006031 [Helianthus annuus]|nr:hypothetical protein HanHA300_Chr01g0006031 [Helianthus annuus]
MSLKCFLLGRTDYWTVFVLLGRMQGRSHNPLPIAQPIVDRTSRADRTIGWAAIGWALSLDYTIRRDGYLNATVNVIT